MVPNGLEMLEYYLGATQIGLYITPINHHLVGPEIAYIVNDSDAKVLLGHERFAAELEKAAAEIAVPADHRFAIGAVDGFRPFAELLGRPARPPRPTTASPVRPCTTRRAPPAGPRASSAQLVDIDPDVLGELYSGFQGMFGVQPLDGHVHITGSPLYHTAVLMWTANALHMGHPVVLMDKWSPEGMLELIDRAPA